MATIDPLYDLLSPNLKAKTTREKEKSHTTTSTKVETSPESVKYLSRLLSLSLADLQQTEPQSLSQQSHSTLLSIQALSSRSHKSTTASSDRLSTLGPSLSSVQRSIEELRGTVPALDDAAVSFAESYGRRGGVTASSTSRIAVDEDGNAPTSALSVTGNENSTPKTNELLKARKESMLLARQADKLQDILELPSLLSASIAAAAAASSASSSQHQQQNTPKDIATTGYNSTAASNYTTTLDLHTHIRRLAILYPDSPLIASLQTQAQAALHDMTRDLITSLRAPRIRLPAAIRTIGWLRRVVPQLLTTSDTDLLALYCGTNIGAHPGSGSINDISNRKFSTTAAELPSRRRTSNFNFNSTTSDTPDARSLHHEDIFPMLFLHARLHAFTTQIDALSPLRDLADQETEKREQSGSGTSISSSATSSTIQQQRRRPSHTASTTSTNATTNVSNLSGHQTERYLKRYVEVFREMSFSSIQMYKNIFPEEDEQDQVGNDKVWTQSRSSALPSVLSTFPIHLVSLLMETLRRYLPNVGDLAARESLLMQVLYAANSLGRLGADFSMMISSLELPMTSQSQGQNSDIGMDTDSHEVEPEWVRIIKKHRIQAARLDALAANQVKSN